MWVETECWVRPGSSLSSRFVLDKYASATVLLPERMTGETEDDHDTRTSVVVSKRQMASVL